MAASPEPPISSLSPSEMELSFPAYALSRWPLISTVMYGGLVVAGVWHAWGGLAIASRRLLAFVDARRPKTSGKARRSRNRKQEDWLRAGGVAGVAGVVGLGLWRLARNSYVPTRVAARMAEVHRRAAPLLYR